MGESVEGARRVGVFECCKCSESARLGEQNVAGRAYRSRWICRRRVGAGVHLAVNFL